MKKLSALVLCLAFAAAPAGAAVTFEYLFDGGYPLAVSDDGSVVAGNTADGSYTPFRWTQATGLVNLGRPQFVGGGGSPGMSSDGTKIASSIGSLDSSYTTQGLWTLGSGWQELLPPGPADMGISDGAYGNVWNLSGDGKTVVGLYWRSGTGKAHASKWTQAGGAVDLGGVPSNIASRANAVNFDGTVITGWRDSGYGPWCPVAWVNGTFVALTTFDLATNNGAGEGRFVTHSGNAIAGFCTDGTTHQSNLAVWTRTGGVFGAAQLLGFIEDSEPTYGKTIPYGMSEDGSIIVGWASTDGSPFAATGFVWTQQTGVVNVNTWLANNGVFADPNFNIQALSEITPDGTKIFGYGQMLVAPYTRKAFRITRTDVLAATPTTSGLALSAPTPNPSTGSSRLDFSLPQAVHVELSIYNLAGRRVTTLVAGDLPAGPQSATWSGRDAEGRSVAPGVYYALLSTPAGARSQRIVRVN